MELFPIEKPYVAMINSPAGVKWIEPLLRDAYQVRVAPDADGLRKLASTALSPELIMLEHHPDNKDSLALCIELKNNARTWDIPVILFSDTPSVSGEINAFESGAADYLSVPTAPEIFMARVKAQMASHSKVDLVRLINSQLEHVVSQRLEELTAVQNATILAMTSLAQTRDIETGNHIKRTQHYVRVLAQRLQKHPRFSSFLTDRNIDLLFKSAPLHDIGKVGIPDRILLKPGRLTADEMTVMKTHTTLGRDTITYAEKLMGTKLDFLTLAKEIAYSHQEKWDGSGYPQGLSGNAIPISARLMAVADVYDAIISQRVYKLGMSHAEAVEIIVEGSGTHFDPDIIDAFLKVRDEFQKIAARYSDSDEEIKEKIQYIELVTGSERLN
jgi:putative two-component system response regulator